MDGRTYPYLRLASSPAVGGLLLDARPAFVISGDGARILWANAAGAAFFGEAAMGDLLARRFSDLNPIKAQAARLGRLLPSETERLEILRFGQGVGLAMLPAACRRLNLAGAERAVLAVAAARAPDGSTTARAERLVDAIGGGDCLAAVLTAEGKVVAASGGLDTLTPAEPAIDGLIAEAMASPERLTGAAIGREGRAAGTARFSAEGREFLLLIVGPPAEAPAAASDAPRLSDARAAETPPPAADAVPEVETEAETEAQVEAEAPPLAPVVRFAWAADSAGRFTIVSPELALAVGAANADVVGRTWSEIAGALDLDPDGSIGAAFDSGAGFAATVYWPDANAGDRIAVDLAAYPAGAGYRGFGVFRTDDRRPDERADRSGFAARTTPDAASTPPADDAPTDVQEPEDLDDAARKSVEEGAGRRDANTPPVPGETGQPSNVVHLATPPAGRTPPENLSGIEREAFRRIAEALGTQPPEVDGKAPAAEPAARPDTGKAAARPPAAVDTRLLDRLPIGIVIFRDRKPLFANRTLLELLGYESYDAFVAAGGAEAIFPGGDDIAGNIAEAGGKLAARGKGGSTVPVKAWLHAITFAGATALMLSIADGRGGDGDDALAVEFARSEARAEELEAILDTATDGVIVIDGRGKIGSMNRAAEALFGVDAGDYRGRYFTDLLADESQKPALDYLDGLASNGVASVLNDGREVIGRVPQGGLIPLFMTMGRIAGTEKFCAVLRDITHWKTVEEELVGARRAAEAASQQKSDFLAKISHEIRTPLNAIIGFSEMMMEERFGPIGNTRYRDYLRDIHVSGGHLMSLINDLLDLSKIEAGKVDLTFEAVPANAVIQDCVALMQPQANRERIIIRTSLATDLPNVVADTRSFRQICSTSCRTRSSSPAPAAR
jgi:PAS domain S-box-containing protein